MWKTIYKIFVDIPAIIASVVIIKDGLQSLISSLSTFHPIVILVLVAGLLSLSYIIVKYLYNRVKQYGMERSINTGKSKVVTTVTSENILPPKNFAENGLELAKQSSSIWDENSTLSGFALYIEVKGVKVEFLTQSTFFSEWKNALLTIYSGQMNSSTHRDNPEAMYKKIPIPFFKYQPNWRKSVQLAFNMFADELGEDFQIVIHSTSLQNTYTISIDYEVNNLSKRQNFSVYENKIVHVATGRSIPF